MSPTSFLPAVFIFISAFFTAYLLSKRKNIVLSSNRYSTIDGLRGYLALAVFLHHSSIWYFYIRSDVWQLPPSRLYVHFGQDAIALFFMITGFLFFSKILQSREKPINWTALYISRLLRLTPLYLVAMLILLTIVYIISDGVLFDATDTLLKNITSWAFFTINGAPDINGVTSTSIIMSGVTWTLPYEWIYYFSLPFLARITGYRPASGYIFITILTLLAFKFFHLDFSLLKSFAGGMIAAYLVKNAWVRKFSIKKSSDFLVVGLFFLVATFFSTSRDILPIILLTTAFTIIAAGNSIFGILTNAASKLLGEIAYSIYLLHGFMLFTVFYFFIGFDIVTTLSSTEHWLILIACTPILIIFSFITFHLIELPAMRLSPLVTNWISSLKIV